jgi:hypothetical protein
MEEASSPNPRLVKLFLFRRQVLTLVAAIKNMREIMLDSSHNGFALDNNLSKREIESLFSSMLLQMMESMKGSLESMILHTNEHSDYVTFCQKIITQVRSQASDIRPLTEFFIHPSNYYWPEKADPKLYGPGLVSYIIRLPRQLSKTSSELFHYLYTGWRNQATCGQLRKYMSFIHEGIKHWDFVQFMLTEFVPATLSVGFNSPGGWILNVAYLPLLASRISKILNKNDPTEATATFDHTVNLLKIIMNGLILVKLRFSPDICLANELSCERGIMPTVCKFWLSVAPPLKNYAMKSSDKSLKLGEVLNALEDFGSQAIIPMVGGGVGYLGPGPFDFVEGKYTKSFAEIMTDDIKRRWRVQEDKITFHALGGPEVITVLGHRALNELVRPLGEVLEGAGTIRVSRIMDVLF